MLQRTLEGAELAEHAAEDAADDVGQDAATDRGV